MIDLHCHLLPAVDDGARDIAESMALVRAAHASGITGAVVTPHIHPGTFDNNDETLIPAFAQLKAAIVAAGLDFRIRLGAEIRLHPDAILELIERRMPMLGRLGAHDVALIEFPDGNIPRGALQACEMLLGSGIRPVLAHPERNKDVMRDPLRITPFVDAGCMLQLTAASIVGRFGEPALAASHRLLAMGMASIVATDAHNLAHRPPLLAEAREALRQLYGQGVAYRLCEETPASIADF
ncbi:MAG: tyrosine-protein phosphatase [Lautropia sp.]